MSKWEVFKRKLNEVLNPGCCFCFLKQAHTPLLLKELRATICLGWELFSGKFGDYLWTQIICKFVGNRPSSWDKLSSSSTIKDLPASVWKQIRPTEQQVPTCTPCQLAVHLLKHIASNSLHVRSLWALSPSLYPFLFSISTSLPFHPLIGVPEPQRGGERGHGVKVFSSLDLGACWERLGERMAALELGLGVKILILLKNSWFEFFFTSFFPPSLHKSREMKNLFRWEPVK